MVFVNIIMVCNPNYTAEKRPTTVLKSISYLQQFIILYKSIKANWNSFPYRVSLCHSIDFSAADTATLSKLDIDIYKIPPDCPEAPYFCRAGCFEVELNNKGTHRLSLDVDMIALREPNLDFNVDFQVAYSNSVRLPEEAVKFMCDKYGLEYVPFEDKIITKLNTRYYNGEQSNLYPYFNGGAVLIKEELCQQFAQLFKPAGQLTQRSAWEGYQGIVDEFHFLHMGCQVLFSLALITLSKNWSHFVIGFNYTWETLPESEFKKIHDKISLYHYKGVQGISYVKRYYSDIIAKYSY